MRGLDDMEVTSGGFGSTIGSDIILDVPTVIETVPEVTKDVETIEGQHGTSIETRVTGIEELVAEIHAVLAHLFPGHFKLPTV
jgi:hypothetical protein